MFTFIELQGFSKRRQLLLPDDKFRIFQALLIQDPTAGEIIIRTASFR
ncbi:type II toxin-antitoxin system RelE/ParE family toxin, partial [Escherichia coli]|nr:type II toxin-antitoxin system RelE/ParE family toxin [Escherichia coli]